jgi:hypothetical protein
VVVQPLATLVDLDHRLAARVRDAQIADFGPNAIDFSLQVLPEPSSVALLGLGLVAAACQVGFATRRACREAIATR